MGEPLISVVVPTFDRVDLLQRTLHALLSQSLTPEAYEVIVVDNGSTDGTAELVNGIVARHGRVRYLYEPNSGVSYAKNAGVDAACTDIVAFTDDDGFPAVNWLATVLAAFRDVDPAPHVVGGPSLPLFMGRRPSWYRESHDTNSWGDAARFLTRKECFFGMNVAFRRDLLLRVGGFNTNLGMRGAALGFHEEPDLFERLWRHEEDLHAYYTPDTVVHHLIPDTRLTPGYRLKRAFAAGQNRHAQERLNAAGAGRPEPGGRELAWETSRFLWYLLWAGVALPRSDHLGDWLITWGTPVASIAGYLAAGAGVRVEVKRDH
jgi:glucosyl-dolichyl phosphate glucuronosyltransferase